MCVFVASVASGHVDVAVEMCMRVSSEEYVGACGDAVGEIMRK